MKLAKMLIVLIVVAICLPPTSSAMHGSDIVLTSSPSVLGARLHLFEYRNGPKSYDVKGDGTGTVTFYRRAVNVGGYPRGAVLQSWVYHFDEAGFNIGDGSAADSVSCTFTTGSKLIVRPIK